MCFFVWIQVPGIVLLVTDVFLLYQTLTILILLMILCWCSKSTVVGNLTHCSFQTLLAWRHISIVGSKSYSFRIWRFISRRLDLNFTEYQYWYLCKTILDALEYFRSSFDNFVISLFATWDWYMISGLFFRSNWKDWKKVICADLSGHFYNVKVYSTLSRGYLLQGLKVTLPAGIIPFAEAICTYIRT